MSMSMSAPSASRSELEALLGELDDLVLERVVETGASVDEIVEALDALVSEHGFGEERHAPTSPRVTEVRAIIEDLFFEDDDEPTVGESPLGGP